MKKIKNTVEVQYSAIELQDAIIMLPIMDALLTSVEKNESLEMGDYCLSPEHSKAALHILGQLGFCSAKEVFKASKDETGTF